jgi:hypothetical protein
LRLRRLIPPGGTSGDGLGARHLLAEHTRDSGSRLRLAEQETLRLAATL